ncbi:conserved exported hypothetical protein [Candidatus Sulfopaludibacter sp. SbA3]|nr:conserved exported hypothetical protein [Candidatus Sulfopaludibacter sp. SbA3]
MRLHAQRTRILTGLALFGLLAGSRAATSEPEDELKSAIVLSFLRYSEWPHRASAGTPLTVGVLGRTSFAQVLHRALDGKVVNDRAIRLLEIKSAGELQGCQVLYVASEKAVEIKPALAEAHSMHALTIGESDHFLEYGGAVNLLLVDGHMSFEVNLQALAGTGVEISSKLLRYGQIKGRRP